MTGAPAGADAGWDVTPEEPFEAVSAELVLTNNGFIVRCKKSYMIGKAFSSGSSHIGDIFGSTWEDCAGPFGLTFTVTQNGVWEIHAIEFDPTDSAVVHGEIRNISVTLSGPLCNVTIEGTLHGTYDNNGTLKINEPEEGDLEVTSASCLGIINAGDRPGCTAAFEVDPAFVVTPA